MENIDLMNQKTEKSPYFEVVEGEKFKTWFEGSVVKDEEGKPLLVFHSTTVKDWDGQAFKINDKSEDWSSFGIYFSSDRESARKYLKESYDHSIKRFKDFLSRDIPSAEKEVIEKDRDSYIKNNESVVKTFNSFLNIKNPLILENHEQLMDLHYSGNTREMIKEKYDGIIIKHDSEFSDQYVVLDPNQIWILPSDIDLHNSK